MVRLRKCVHYVSKEKQMGKVKEVWAILQRHGFTEKSFKTVEEMLTKAKQLEEEEYKELAKIHPKLVSMEDAGRGWK